MVANGHNFHIWDRANNVTSIGEINLAKHSIPEEIEPDFNAQTYLAGSRRFKLKEMEVYQVNAPI